MNQNESNKVQHSPDIWQTKAENWERLAMAKLQSVKDMKAHADKLAGALRHLMAITPNDSTRRYKEAKQTLAAYEEGK